MEFALSHLLSGPVLPSWLQRAPRCAEPRGGGGGTTVFPSVSALSKATWYPDTEDSHGDSLLDVGVATSRKPPNALVLLPALHLTVKKTAHEQTVYNLN